jgi:hypothetical protein
VVPSPLTDTPCVAWLLRISGPSEISGLRMPSTGTSLTEHGGVIFRLESKQGDVLVVPPASDPPPANWVGKAEPAWRGQLELPTSLELIDLEPPPIIPRRLDREAELLRARGIQLTLGEVHVEEFRVEPGARIAVTGLVTAAAGDGEQGFRDPERRFQLVPPLDGALRIRGT